MSAERSLRGLGVRARTTLVAVIVVGLALLAGAAAFTSITRSRLEELITTAAITRVEAIASLIGAGVPIDPLPGGDLDLMAQVIDTTGHVVAADRTMEGVAPLVTAVLTSASRTIVQVDRLPELPAGNDDKGPFVVVSQAVDSGRGLLTIATAASLEDAVHALEASEDVLAIGLPILLVLVGVTTWQVAGRALRPVERMRMEAERISTRDLHRRLPLPSSRDEPRRLALTLNEMLDRLAQGSVRQRRFISDASHELRSPLTTMKAVLEVSRLENPDREDMVDPLLREVDRMERMVANMIHLARHDEARPLEIVPDVSLDGLARAEVAKLGLKTDVRIDTTGLAAVSVAGDSHELAQLVHNLTDNAVRHAATMIWLETGLDDGEAAFLVSDDGPGIPEAERERIFERFVRLDESRSRETGDSGLGLAIARTVAERHGGTVRVVEPRKGGATFEVRIPVGPPDQIR